MSQAIEEALSASGERLDRQTTVVGARNALMDVLFRNLTRMFAILVLGLLVAILVSLAIGGWTAIDKFGWRFLTTAEWNPVTNEFGALVPIYGTLATSVIALLIAIPVSF